MVGGVPIGAWNLLPTVTPCVSWTLYQPINNNYVHCNACSYLVTLDGADEPMNQMQIEIDTYVPSIKNEDELLLSSQYHQ